MWLTLLLDFLNSDNCRLQCLREYRYQFLQPLILAHKGIPLIRRTGGFQAQRLVFNFQGHIYIQLWLCFLQEIHSSSCTDQSIGTSGRSCQDLWYQTLVCSSEYLYSNWSLKCGISLNLLCPKAKVWLVVFHLHHVEKFWTCSQRRLWARYSDWQILYYHQLSASKWSSHTLSLLLWSL